MKTVAMPSFSNKWRGKRFSLRFRQVRMGIVSNDQDSLTFVPAAGTRRVSALVCLPVILGCAVLGSILGVTHPLRSIFPDQHRAEPPADLSPASIKLIDNGPAAGQNASSPESPVQPSQPVTAEEARTQAPSRPASAAALVSTGSVERSLSPGESEKAALAAPEGEQAERAEPAPRLTGQHPRIARAKRLRRMVSRRARSSKPKTSGLEQFFSPLFPKK